MASGLFGLTTADDDDGAGYLPSPGDDGGGRSVDLVGPDKEPGLGAPPGADGRGIKDSAIDEAGHLLLRYSDGAVQDAGRVRGRDGEDGKASAINATFTVSTQPPSVTDGQDGDVWFQITP